MRPKPIGGHTSQRPKPGKRKSGVAITSLKEGTHKRRSKPIGGIKAKGRSQGRGKKRREGGKSQRRAHRAAGKLKTRRKGRKKTKTKEKQREKTLQWK